MRIWGLLGGCLNWTSPLETSLFAAPPHHQAERANLRAQVWLDGAIARLVVGYKGAAVVQCALVLHRSHAPPSGAHLTGDQGEVSLPWLGSQPRMVY